MMVLFFPPVRFNAMSISVFGVGNHLLRMMGLGVWPHPSTHFLVSTEEPPSTEFVCHVCPLKKHFVWISFQ